MSALLASAAAEVLAAWDAEDEYEREDLSDQLWAAMNALRLALTEYGPRTAPH